MLTMMLSLANAFGRYSTVNRLLITAPGQARGHQFISTSTIVYLRGHADDADVSSPDVTQSYVLGYGSIMCPVSRAITSPELASTVAIPVQVQNTERVWSKRSSVRGMTAMGVQRGIAGAKCTAVMLPVTSDQLRQFDEREAGYNRLPVPVQDIAKVPFLVEGSYYQDNDCDDMLDNLLLLETREESPQTTNIWIYEPAMFCPPSPDKPIVQTYVDTILRGCLSISEEFAEDFLRTTKGWSPADFDDVGDDDDKENYANNNHNNHFAVHWVNDRHDPIYLRGDQDYMLKHADQLDAILQRCRVQEFPFRMDLHKR